MNVDVYKNKLCFVKDREKELCGIGINTFNV